MSTLPVKKPSRTIWDIPGGVHPAENKVQSLELDLGRLPLPDRLVVPLNQHSGAPSTPLVKLGEPVLKGQKIADASGYISAATHAPTSGTVVAIDQQQVPHPSGMNALCITIDVDGEEQWAPQTGPEASAIDYSSETPQQLLTRVREAGIAGLGGAGFPAAVKLAAAEKDEHQIETLIINATECEPYITADDMLMRTYPDQVVEGIKVLAHMLGQPKQILIGIEDNKVKAYDTLLPHLEGTNIELVEFPTKYPSGGEKQLIQILTGQELANGKLPSDIGIVCQNIGTVHAIFRAVVENTPLISRITTVTGDACGSKRNFELLIGTPIDYVLEKCGFDAKINPKVVMGGPMMGFALPNTAVPVIKTTNCILAPSHQEMPPSPPAQPCIRCGMCADACPASLLPQQLFWYAQSRNHQRLQAHNLFDCIECGACAYVCPSNIPLVQYYRSAKSEIHQQAREKIKADRARERFEFNKQRKQQAEAEKAAKREARRLAAEQAKAKMSQADTGGTSPSNVVQAALQQVAAKQVSPEQQRAKLERSVSSAESRLQRLETKLSEGQAPDADTPLTAEQIEGYKAQIESARIKLTDAKQKLADFRPDDATAEKVKAKVLASPRQTLEAKVESLQKRVQGIEEKIAACDDDSLREALNNSLSKFQGKLSDARNDLRDLSSDGDKPGSQQVTDPATVAATDRAIARANANQQQSSQAQLQAKIDKMHSRIANVRKQLAEAEDPSMAEALQKSLSRMEQKLADAEAEMEKVIS